MSWKRLKSKKRKVSRKDWMTSTKQGEGIMAL